MSLPLLIALVGAGVLVLVFLAVMFFRGTGRPKKTGRDKQSIVRAANRKLAQNPKDVEALSAVGEIYFDEQDWEKAAMVYSKLGDLVATNPDLDEPLILMRHGLASMQLKKYQDAYRSLMLASRELTDVFEINYNLGQLELKQKKFERAASMLQKAHKQRPEHVPTARYLGQALFRIKRFADAIDTLRKAVDSDPSDKDSLFFLGQSYYELGNLDRAGRIFRQLRTDPDYGPRSSLISGSIQLKNQIYPEAEIDFQIGLKHESAPPDVRMELMYRLAATYTRLKEVEKALRTLTELAKINPAYKDVTHQIARAKELAGNKNLQVFLMGQASEFVGLCRRIVSSYFDESRVKITDISVSRAESADVLAEVRTSSWEDTVLFRFMRTNGQTGELVVRDLYSRIKDVHAGRGVCLSAGPFSEGAHEFVNARYIDLVEKEHLLKVLQKS